MSQTKLKMAKSAFRKNRADFFTDIAAALRDKSDLVTEVTNLLNRAEQRKKIGDIMMYREWLSRMERGNLTEALSNTLPSTDLMIMGAFEHSGRLADGLDFMAKTVKMAGRMKSRIIAAIAAPSFVLLIIMGILALHAFMLTPIMTQIYEVKDWPFVGQILYPVSQLIRHYGIFLVIALVSGLVAFGISINRWVGDKRVTADKYLPYSIFRDYNGALFLTSLAAMMKSGTGLLESLKSLDTLSSPWMKWHIRQMIGRLDKYPDESARALDTGAIPPLIMDRIIDYGKRSNFLEAMTVIGLDSMSRTEEKLGKSASQINIFMMLIAGVLFILVIAGTMLTGLHAQDVIRAKIH